MNSIIALTKCYDFAARRHVGHRRKGDAAEPYLNHLTEVAELVARATDGRDLELVMAAVLHDTLEDTQTAREELAAEFGARVAGLVAEVSDDKSLPAAERKRLQVEHAAHASVGAKIIKIADKTSNLRALLTSPPSGWARERRQAYADWAIAVVDRCRGVNRWLEGQFDASVQAAVAVPRSEPA